MALSWRDCHAGSMKSVPESRQPVAGTPGEPDEDSRSRLPWAPAKGSMASENASTFIPFTEGQFAFCDHLPPAVLTVTVIILPGAGTEGATRLPF